MKPRFAFVGLFLCVLAIAALLVLPGCVERKEKITVALDGSVKIEVVHQSESSGDLHDGDAIPALEAGWWVREREDVDEKGKHTFTLTAEIALPPGAKQPSTFATAKDSDRELYLQFPTTLKIERRSDGVYYHWRRVYSPRPWAQVDALSRKVQQRMQELGQKPKADVTHADRVAVVQALTGVEVIKLQYFARLAWKDIMPEAPQDGWLRIHTALASLKDSVDVERLARLIENGNRDEDNQALIEAEAKVFEKSTMNILRTALAAGGFGGGQVQSFLQRFEWHKRYHQVTEDIGDDAFEITLEMPGELVASNADLPGGSRASWRFSGDFIRDRELELMATSRVKY